MSAPSAVLRAVAGVRTVNVIGIDGLPPVEPRPGVVRNRKDQSSFWQVLNIGDFGDAFRWESREIKPVMLWPASNIGDFWDGYRW